MLKHYSSKLYQCLAAILLLLAPLALSSQNILEVHDQALCTIKSSVWLKRDGDLINFAQDKGSETFIIRRTIDTIDFPVKPNELALDTTLPFKILRVLGGEITSASRYSKLTYDDGVLMYTTMAYSQIKAIVAHCTVFDY